MRRIRFLQRIFHPQFTSGIGNTRAQLYTLPFRPFSPFLNTLWAGVYSSEPEAVTRAELPVYMRRFLHTYIERAIHAAGADTRDFLDEIDRPVPKATRKDSDFTSTSTGRVYRKPQVFWCYSRRRCVERLAAAAGSGARLSFA